jgi:hypothetical protein
MKMMMKMLLLLMMMMMMMMLQKHTLDDHFCLFWFCVFVVAVVGL